MPWRRAETDSVTSCAGTAVLRAATFLSPVPTVMPAVFPDRSITYAPAGEVHVLAEAEAPNPTTSSLAIVVFADSAGKVVFAPFAPGLYAAAAAWARGLVAPGVGADEARVDAAIGHDQGRSRDAACAREGNRGPRIGTDRFLPARGLAERDGGDARRRAAGEEADVPACRARGDAVERLREVEEEEILGGGARGDDDVEGGARTGDRCDRAGAAGPEDCRVDRVRQRQLAVVEPQLEPPAPTGAHRAPGETVGGDVLLVRVEDLHRRDPLGCELSSVVEADDARVRDARREGGVEPPAPGPLPLVAVDDEEALGALALVVEEDRFGADGRPAHRAVLVPVPRRRRGRRRREADASIRVGDAQAAIADRDRDVRGRLPDERCLRPSSPERLRQEGGRCLLRSRVPARESGELGESSGGESRNQERQGNGERVKPKDAKAPGISRALSKPHFGEARHFQITRRSACLLVFMIGSPGGAPRALWVRNRYECPPFPLIG